MIAAGLVLEIALLSVLLVAWVVSLVAVMFDSISILGKIAWLLALTLLAPFAIPLYAIVRLRRNRAHLAASSRA